ncbi:unnamed protein product [Brassica rapa subsp. narinosa]
MGVSWFSGGATSARLGEQVTSCDALRISAGDDLSLFSPSSCLRCFSFTPWVAIKMLESEIFWSVSRGEARLEGRTVVLQAEAAVMYPVARVSTNRYVLVSINLYGPVSFGYLVQFVLVNDVPQSVDQSVE